MQQLNSMIMRIMLPLVLMIGLIIATTVFMTDKYLKKTVEEVYIQKEVEHLKAMVQSKIDTKLLTIVRDSMLVATCPDTVSYLQSKEAQEGVLTENMKQKLDYFKNFYNLETVYVAELQERNYFRESGFIKKVGFGDSQEEWFDTTLNNQTLYTINIDSFQTDQLTVWIDVVVHDGQKKVGLAGGGVKIRNILSPVESIIDKLQGKAYLFDRSSHLRSELNTNYPLDTHLNDLPLDLKERNVFQEIVATKEALLKYEHEGKTRFLLHILVQSLGWDILIDFPDTTFLEPLDGVVSRIITSGVVTLIITLLFGWMAFSYLVARPIHKVTLALEKYDFRSEFHLDGFKNMGYEIDKIIHAFQKSVSLYQKTLHSYRTSEELLRNVTNATSDLIFYKDRDQKYIGCNKSYQQWIAKESDAILNASDYELYPFPIAQKHYLTDMQVMQTQQTLIIEEELQSADGKRVVLQISKSPLRNNEEQVYGIVGIARDITHIKDLEKKLRDLNNVLEVRVVEKTKELQVSNEELANSIKDLRVVNKELQQAEKKAQEAVETRSNFLSNISHELRTPMNAIINFTDQIFEDFDEIVEDEKMQEEAKMFLQRVLVNSKHLLHLINELLEFTKAESGKIDYDMGKHFVNEIVEIAYKNTRSLLQNSDIIEYRIKIESKPLFASIDSRRFLQVLLNLISNAIKFTKEGYIELRCFEQEDSIIVEIEDTGRGIPAEKIESVFNPFIQANRNDPGTGLGLGLAKKMCEDMGIKISVRSKEAQGTLFSLVLAKVEL